MDALLARDEDPRVDLGAFFDALPLACASLDKSLRIVGANHAFLGLVALPSAVGRLIHDLLRIDDSLVPGPREQRLRARLASGEPVTLRLSPTATGGYVALVQPLAREESEERTLLVLSRDTIASTTEEEVVAALSKALRALFPGAFFCVRVVDPRTCALTSLYAEGKLRDGARADFAIGRSAAEKLGLDKAHLPPERVRVLDEPPSVFVGAARGCCTPLVAGGSLFGVLNIEYPASAGRDSRADERLVIRAANQVSLGLRNVKLYEEVSYVRRYLEQLIERANAIIVVVNPERRIIVFNEAVATLSGYSREQVLGRSFLDFIPEAEHGRFQRLVVSALRDKPVANFETGIRHADGHTIRVALSTAAVRGPSGDVEGVIAVGQDLTQMKNLELAVIQAEKLASLGQLAAGVAHEINNPLTTISIYADALARKLQGVLAIPGADRPVAYGDGADLEKLGRILEASDRILKLARDLTSYARPAPDKADAVDIHPVLDQAVGFCDHIVKESGVQIARHYQSQLPRIPGLRSNLVQVFVNLVTNACHATASGGSVILTTAAGVTGGIEVRVEDTVSGIAPEHLEHIFEPFFTTKGEGNGTGLGLSIVQGIIANHGGSVDVESQPGTGTTFIVRLPGE